MTSLLTNTPGEVFNANVHNDHALGKKLATLSGVFARNEKLEQSIEANRMFCLRSEFYHNIVRQQMLAHLSPDIMSEAHWAKNPHAEHAVPEKPADVVKRRIRAKRPPHFHETL